MVTKHCKSELGHFRVDRPQLRLRPLAAGVCACLAFGGTAYGQSDGVEEVLVTGSRIVRRDLDAPSPIITVDSELFEQNSSVADRSGAESVPAVQSGCHAVHDGRNSADGDDVARCLDAQHARPRREPESGAARRPARPARQRGDDRGRQHDSGRRDRGRRSHQRRRRRDLRTGRHGRRRQLQVEQATSKASTSTIRPASRKRATVRRAGSTS